MPSVTIIGGGLAGCLMSLFLARRGYQVSVFESRDDLRLSPHDYGRSINMALSCRGITALTEMNLLDTLKPIMVPMRARAIYEQNRPITYQPFGRHSEEYINSIKRTDLNRMLLDCMDETDGIDIHFNHQLKEIDFERKQCDFFQYGNGSVDHHYDFLIGADGAPSVVRECLNEHGHIKSERSFLEHGYKELTIVGPDDQSFIKEHLHLWPRDKFMLLGNPNPDDSITGSLFLPMTGESSFEAIQSEDAIKQFFQQQFNDIYAQMPALAEEYMNHPVGYLSTVQCAPWYYQDQCLLIGDAAHGIVPFFGQGMNSAFEDCRILDQLIGEYDGNWSQILPQFYQLRKENADAVAAMSMDNYDEIRHDVLDDQFLLRKALEHELMRRYPEQYLSRHIMVMFTNLPYKVAQEQANKQLAIIDTLCAGKQSLDDIDWQQVDLMVEQNELNTFQLIESYQAGMSNSQSFT